MTEDHRQPQPIDSVSVGVRAWYPQSGCQRQDNRHSAGVEQLDYKSVHVWVTAIFISFVVAVTACYYLITDYLIGGLFATLHNRHYAHM